MSDIAESLPGWIVLSVWLAVSLLVSSLEGSLSWGLAQVWLANTLPYFLLGLAAAVVISCGQIDISTGGVMSLAGMLIVATVSVSTGGVVVSGIVAHLLALIVTLAIYLLYALAARVGLSTLVVTLGFLLITKGSSTLLQSCMQGVGEICRMSTALTGGSAVLPQRIVLSVLGNGMFAAVAFSGVLVAAFLWRYKTRWGLEHVAIGMDLRAAAYCRISKSRIYFGAFLVSGILVFLATVVRLHGPGNGGWSANTGWGDELIAIAIAVIGGTRITGGKFDPVGLLLASLSVYISRDVITSDLGVPSEVASLIFGGVLLAVVVMDLYRRPLGKLF